MGDGMRETKNGKLETENKDKIDSIAKLDLKEFIASFTSFLAREKPLYISGDINMHKKFIDEVVLPRVAPELIEEEKEDEETEEE